MKAVEANSLLPIALSMKEIREPEGIVQLVISSQVTGWLSAFGAGD